MSPAMEHLVRLAEAEGATVVRTPAALVLVIPTTAAADPAEHLSLEQARILGKLPTTRPIKEAGRAGLLTLYGTERTRTVKRGAFMAWLKTRRAPVVAVARDQAARVELRLGKRRSTGSSRRRAA